MGRVASWGQLPLRGQLGVLGHRRSVTAGIPGRAHCSQGPGSDSSSSGGSKVGTGGASPLNFGRVYCDWDDESKTLSRGDSYSVAEGHGGLVLGRRCGLSRPAVTLEQ